MNRLGQRGRERQTPAAVCMMTEADGTKMASFVLALPQMQAWRTFQKHFTRLI